MIANFLQRNINNDDDDDDNNNNCDPSTELSSGYMVTAMENSPVREVETARSCNQQTKRDHMTTLYKHGYAAAGELNPQTSYADLDLDEMPSMFHSEWPPPPMGYIRSMERISKDQS